MTRLKQTPVAAVELHRPRVAALGGGQARHAGGARARCATDGAALLVETRAATAAALAVKVDAIVTAARRARHARARSRFTTDPAECGGSGTCARACSRRSARCGRIGTTVIIEDVAFPIERLAEATVDLQQLLHEHGYHEAIIFGHALEGNLHFVFTQDFGNAAEVERYRRFMDEMCAMVVEKYDGSLKAEHGTGRNVAPFVELEWGAQAYALMRASRRCSTRRACSTPA